MLNHAPALPSLALPLRGRTLLLIAFAVLIFALPLPCAVLLCAASPCRCEAGLRPCCAAHSFALPLHCVALQHHPVPLHHNAMLCFALPLPSRA